MPFPLVEMLAIQRRAHHIQREWRDLHGIAEVTVGFNFVAHRLDGNGATTGARVPTEPTVERDKSIVMRRDVPLTTSLLHSSPSIPSSPSTPTPLPPPPPPPSPTPALLPLLLPWPAALRVQSMSMPTVDPAVG